MFFSNKDQFKELSGYEINGIWYPRVTRIVGIKAKPALYRFYAEMENFAQGEEVKKKSASEGTLIHEYAEKMLKGEIIKEIPDSIKPAMEALSKFLSEINIQVDSDFVERRVISHKQRYAGTIDSLALINGRIGVLDIKTSAAIYRDYTLQTSAYVAALREEGKNIQTQWILRIDQIRKCLFCSATLREKGGRKKIKGGKQNCDHKWSEIIGEVELKEFPYWQENYEAFLAAKKLWEWDNQYWLKQIGYL